LDARPKPKGRGRKKAVRDCFLDWNQFQYILLWLWLDSDTRHLEAEASVDRQTLSLTIPCGINIYRSPDPKSSNPVFEDGVLIDGELIFKIVEEKTVGASQGGLVHVVFRVKGPEVTR
jgi:DNA-directed RNA polymerase II subunit RPB1